MFLQKSPSNFLSSQTWHISISFSQKGKSTNVLSLYLQFHLTPLPFTPLLFLCQRNGHCSSLILSIAFENKRSTKSRFMSFSCTSNSSSQLSSSPFEDTDTCLKFGYSLAAQSVKNLTAMQKIRVRSLGQEDPLGEGKGYPLQQSRDYCIK